MDVLRVVAPQFFDAAFGLLASVYAEVILGSAGALALLTTWLGVVGPRLRRRKAGHLADLLVCSMCSTAGLRSGNRGHDAAHGSWVHPVLPVPRAGEPVQQAQVTPPAGTAPRRFSPAGGAHTEASAPPRVLVALGGRL